MQQRLSEMGIELNVLTGTSTPEELVKKDSGTLSSPWCLKVPCRYYRVNGVQFVLQPIPKTLLTRQDLVIVAHENTLLLNYCLLIRKHISKMRLAFWGHGANFQTHQKNSLGEKLKSWTATKADWWFAYTSLSVEHIVASGFPKEYITCLNNAIDLDVLTRLRENIFQPDIELLKIKLGFGGKHVGVFLGSLYAQKRLYFLFESADELKRQLPDFELLIIGDGPLRDIVRKFAEKRSWVRWVGAIHGREKVLHMALGHVMLNPGLVGLGILDSFAMGMPVVTTDCGIHSPEIAYLESGRNGLMVDNDIKAYVEGVLSLFTNATMYASMATACNADRDRYSLDKMVEAFCGGIFKAIGAT
jgi:glycosyltransferase involved in cell wall biosynthesis